MKPDLKLRKAFILGALVALLIILAGVAFNSWERAPDPVIVARQLEVLEVRIP